jgi:hypothetical protein
MEKKNYQIRIGSLKCIAWSNVDKNGNNYYSYQLSRSIKQTDGTYKEEKINLFAGELCIFSQIIERMIAGIAVRPTSFVSQDTNSMPPSEIPDDMGY